MTINIQLPDSCGVVAAGEAKLSRAQATSGPAALGGLNTNPTAPSKVQGSWQDPWHSKGVRPEDVSVIKPT